MGQIVDTERKYRPHTLADFVYANDEIKDVVSSYGSGNITRPLILSGTNGTGKSLLAELIPKAIEGFTPAVNRVRSCDLNSNKEIYSQFTRNKQFDLLFTTNNQRYNYYIIEEVNFDPKSSDAFRVVLDDYRGVDLTIMTSNEVAKIDIGIRSRCEVLTVPPCEPHVFLPRAKTILEEEGFVIDEKKLLSALEAVYEVKADNRLYYQKLDEILRKADS